MPNHALQRTRRCRLGRVHAFGGRVAELGSLGCSSQAAVAVAVAFGSRKGNSRLGTSMIVGISVTPTASEGIGLLIETA